MSFFLFARYIDDLVTRVKTKVSKLEIFERMLHISSQVKLCWSEKAKLRAHNISFSFLTLNNSVLFYNSYHSLNLAKMSWPFACQPFSWIQTQEIYVKQKRKEKRENKLKKTETIIQFSSSFFCFFKNTHANSRERLNKFCTMNQDAK